MGKVNIAIAGGPCEGKSVLAANLYAQLKVGGFDYDLVLEECRKLKGEFGGFRCPFERFYMWRQQEREELRSTAADGFVTDKPLFHYYAQAKQFATEPRHMLAVRELHRMCLEQLEDRYHVIVMAENPDEFGYKTDESRKSSRETARQRRNLIYHFVQHMWPQKLLLVKGPLDQRTKQVLERVRAMHSSTK